MIEPPLDARGGEINEDERRPVQDGNTAQTTDGIDVSSKFKESLESGDEGIMSAIVKLAERNSVERGNMAEEEAFELRREYGARGLSSLVVIHNRTAARLVLDRHSNRAGNLHEKSCFPEVLEPGSNGAFLHVGNRRDCKVPSKGLLVYCIGVYDDAKGEWKESAFSLAFSWETGAYGGYVGVKFESARERIVHHTKTKYDGQKILGEANVKKSKLGGVFVVTFSQKSVEEIDMPLSSKVIDFFQTSLLRGKSEARVLDNANETTGKEEERTEAKNMELSDQKDITLSKELEDIDLDPNDTKVTREQNAVDVNTDVSVPKDTTVAKDADIQYMHEVNI